MVPICDEASIIRVENAGHDYEKLVKRIEIAGDRASVFVILRRGFSRSLKHNTWERRSTIRRITVRFAMLVLCHLHKELLATTCCVYEWAAAGSVT